VILADEPTGNLDPETASQVIRFFEEFNEEGRTIVMVTHDPRAAERAKHMIRLAEGRLVGESPATRSRCVA
jgi:putative ABC transport system ATP-binding protein